VFAGGIRDVHHLNFSSFRAARPSNGFVDRYEHLDAIYDMDFVQQNLGRRSARRRSWCSTNPPTAARGLDLAQFYAHDSCGKVPRRVVSTRWIEKVLSACLHGSVALMTSICSFIVGSGISPNVETAPFTQTTPLPPGPSLVSADCQPPQVLPRRDRGALPLGARALPQELIGAQRA